MKKKEEVNVKSCTAKDILFISGRKVWDFDLKYREAYCDEPCLSCKNRECRECKKVQ